MNDSRQNFEERALRWQFWFVAAFSLFLIITFVYYLPLRFVHRSGEPEAMHGAQGGGAAHGAVYHEEGEVRDGLAVNLNVTPVPLFVGTSTRLDFFVNEKPGNVPVPANALEIEHEKIMHVIGVREDMNEFFHIHPVRSDLLEASPVSPLAKRTSNGVHPLPTTTPGILSVDYVFVKPGAYKVWSEIKQGGVNHSFGHPEFSVLGQGPRSEKQVSFSRNAIVGLYQVALEIEEPVAKGHAHELAFDIHTVTGDEVEVEPYLAADMHLTIIRDDWKQFIHTHPAGTGDHHGLRILPVTRAHGNEDIPGAVHDETGKDEVIRFAVTFPESGLYRAFAQFRPRGIGLPPDEALLASFWIRVEEKVPAAIPQKVLYTVASLLLIGLLSWGVKRYLTLS